VAKNAKKGVTNIFGRRSPSHATPTKGEGKERGHLPQKCGGSTRLWWLKGSPTFHKKKKKKKTKGKKRTPWGQGSMKQVGLPVRCFRKGQNNNSRLKKVGGN